MIIFNELQKKVDRIQSITEHMPNWARSSDTYESQRLNTNIYFHSLYKLFGNDASQVIAILDSLDFNNLYLQRWLSEAKGFAGIINNLSTFGQKFLVIEHFRELRKSFPDMGLNEEFDRAISLAEWEAGYFS